MPIMTNDCQKCLAALDNLTHPDGEMCVPFAPIMADTGFDRATVRRYIQDFASQGLAQYFRGLVKDSGQMAGAGYCITRAGRLAIQDMKGDNNHE